MILTIGAPGAEAQRGGHAGMRGHAAFPAGGRAITGRNFAVGPPASPSPPVSPFPGFGVANRQFGRGGLNRGFSHTPGANGFRGGRSGIGERNDFRHEFGHRRMYPFAAIPGPYFLPPIMDYGLPFGYGFDDDDTQNYGPAYQPGPDPDEEGLQMNQAAMADQLQRLNAEISDLESARQYGPTGPPPSPYAQPEAQPAQPPQPPVTLVLRDGQELKIHSYAVMNGTFWDFSDHPVRKIPVSSIDIAGSEKATEASGGEFPAISASQ